MIVRRSLTYPKDGERKMREDNKQLRMQVSRLRKENSILRNELENIMKPVRTRKEHVEQVKPQEMTHEEWRKNFVKQFRPRLQEIKEDGSEDSET